MMTCVARLGRWAAIALGALGVCAGCRPKPRQGAAPGASTAIAPQLAPLTAESWLIELDVEGFGKAALAVPLGAAEPRPVVIALHGVADRPEWACGAWRGVVGPWPFLLCPRGAQRSDFTAPDVRYTFGSANATASELRAGLTALKRAFGVHVASGSVVLTGFEIGADRAASLARLEPTFFARLAFVNPSPDTWPSSQAALFGRQGGQRVLFACGLDCKTVGEFKAVLTRRGGADARAVFLGDRPPALDAAAIAVLAGAWPWLSAPPDKLPVPENLVGNPLSAKGPEAPQLR